MPTYEYQCKKCGQNVEAFQKFSDASLTVHDACGGEFRKVFHARGVVFKGSGFYVTDSRNGSTSTTTGGNGSDSDSSSKKTDSSSKKKETKETASATAESTSASGDTD